jgi:hypothetical protein
MTQVTRSNIDQILDSRQLYVALKNGRWWQARRNGATKTWKKDASRVYIPFKYGFKGYGQITETYFHDGILDQSLFRHVEDVPANLRP